MGAEQSHNRREIIYQTDPAILKLLESYQEQLNTAKKQAVKLKQSPEKFKEVKEEIFTDFLEGLRSLKLEEAIKKNPGELHIAFIGDISSGKSTLIKALTGASVKVGLGDTTSECKEVWRGKVGDTTLVVWDVPGVNEDFEIYDPDNLAFVKSLDVVALCYNNSIKTCQHVLRTCDILNPNLLCVRTCCDNWTPDQKSVPEVVEDDKNDQQRYIKKKLKTFAVSAKAVLENKPNTFDFDKLKSELKL